MCVVCVCVCVCVCVMERLHAASISSMADWCMVLCMYICKCTNECIEIVWVCFIHPAQLKTLRAMDFMLSGLSLLYTAAPSDRLAAVRIEGIKRSGHLDVKGSMFPLFQLRTSTSAGGWVWLRSGVRPLPNSTLTPRWAC